MNRVVVTGMGTVNPLGNNVDSYFENLVEGKSGAGPITRFNADKHSVKIACEVKDFNFSMTGMEKRDEKRFDLSSQFCLAACEEALKDSNIVNNDKITVEPHNVGIILGTIGGLESYEKQAYRNISKGPSQVRTFTVSNFMSNAVASNIGIKYGFNGESKSICEACASANAAMGDAYFRITHGLEKIVITGGSEAPIAPVPVAAFTNMGALTKEHGDNPEKASRPFDRDRSGFVIGEGAGILIFEDLESAIIRKAKIYAEVTGYGATSDAYHITSPEETGRWQMMSMAKALTLSGVNPKNVDYINAHGTSTILNDKIETSAIKSLFGSYSSKVAISSNKSMIGHLCCASGGPEMIATILSINHGIIPPTINLENSDVECDLDYVPNEARNANVDIAMSNSFGFGGHNSVLVVKKYRHL